MMNSPNNSPNSSSRATLSSMNSRRNSSRSRRKIKCLPGKSTSTRKSPSALRARSRGKWKWPRGRGTSLRRSLSSSRRRLSNQKFRKKLRATKSTLAEYESRTEKTMQELAIVRCEIEQTNQNNKEVVTRLKNQLKEAEQQLYAIHQIREKKQQQKQKERMNSLGESQIAVSEITVSNPNAFKETLKGIREYMASLDSRKVQIRKMVLRV